MKDSENKESAITSSLAQSFRERLRAVKNVSERRTLGAVARKLSHLPGDVARAVLETSASIAGVSWRASVEFLRAAPDAALVLEASDLRAWGEMGRRLAMGDVETAVTFFAEGVDKLKDVPRDAMPLLFQVCTRQMTLSSSIAVDTFRKTPTLVQHVKDESLLRSIFAVAADISHRSAKHSADFLSVAPKVLERANEFGKDSLVVGRASVTLASAFAARAGGMAADAWGALPSALVQLRTEDALKLLRETEKFLERGGGAALHVLSAGGETLRNIPEAFDSWIELNWTIAAQGNAPLVAFVRSSPPFFRFIRNEAGRGSSIELARRVIAVTRDVALLDAEAAILCFRSSLQALQSVTIEQFEEWARDGLEAKQNGDAKARRSYFALETKRSNESLHAEGGGLALDKVQHTLRLYVEGLTGREVDVAPLAAVPQEARIGDGKIIYLPSMIAEFGDEELDFKLYKVLAAHAAGQIEFGTRERDSVGLQAAYSSLAETYLKENVDAIDAFSLSGYIEDVQKGERALSPEEQGRLDHERRKKLPPDSDYRVVLKLFPAKALAQKIFGTLENGRIDRRLRHAYKGLARDLNFVSAHLKERRPRIIDLPLALIPFELLFQIALCGGALDDARQFYSQIVSDLETIVAEYLTEQEATVADTLMATSRVYTLFQNVTPERENQADKESEDETSDEQEGQQETPLQQKKEEQDVQAKDARDIFNAWNSSESQGEPEDLDGAEMWTQKEVPEHDLEEGEVAFNYDEWDRELVDHRTGWCRVIEKKVKQGDRAFVEVTRDRYRGVISSIRHQFQLMKPENLKKINNELDGEDYDLNAVIDYIVDRRADGQQSERLYTKRLRRQRDVAVSFLLDQSSSTARTIGRHPLQPYTHPGRRIIEVEKEGLVLMSEALEAVGDVYSINGFTSEGRRNVKFYVVKDFSEKFSDEIERRIGGISYQNNTRLGAAIRHAAARLVQQDARTKLLIVLSDGRPYDHDYGDARYAREDTREALRQAKLQGITPFCITIDRDSESELKDLYGDIGYTIIDDVLSLPERMPGIYRRLTT
jgi:nitric oxide reductase activation protein